ncbi:hypothetical protein LTR27_005884 [Elasticomyces elasticus]|nr:hypothetical protein LTR27_005884 [Elasticomyces elasticus]
MHTEAIAAGAAASNQALLSAALIAKDTKDFCVPTAVFEGRVRSSASPELVARVYEKLHEIMSILEEDQKVQEVKDLLETQSWEELTNEMMEVNTPEFEIAKENLEVVPEMITKVDKFDEKVSKVDVQKQPKTTHDEVSEHLEAGKVAVKGFLCRTLGRVLLLAALVSIIVGIGLMYKAMEAAVIQDGIGLFEALLVCAFFFLYMIVAPWGLALVCAEKLGVDMGPSTKQ